MSIIATKYGYDKLGNRNMVIDPKENVTYFNYDLQGRLRSTISPDGNIAYYEYNKVGSLTSKKDENGNTIDYTYDKVYRLTRKDYPDSTHAYFSYDAVGRRLHMQDANTLTYFTYDAGGQLTDVHDCILDKTISYTYDKLGRRDSMTDPEGDVIYYDYDSVKLIRIKRNTDEEAYYAYDAGGRRNYTRIGNSSYTYYDYDVNGRLTRVANHKSDESVISTFDYTLDPVGNRIAMQINSGDTVYYEYDGIYQLVKEDRRDSGDALVYTNYFEYDLAGNRTHLHFVDPSTDDWTYYTYNIENQLTIEETGGTATYYEYDAAGALLRKKSGGTISYYEYNYDGLMDRFNEGEDVATFTFDADNRRIAADRNGTVEKYELSGDDVVADYDSNDSLVATYNIPSLDANLTKKISNNIYFYVADGLGSVRNILDANELVKNTYDYLAFGGIHGTPTENISNRYRFTSREWESIPALHYYRARMMDQTLGRFLSKDPIACLKFWIADLKDKYSNITPDDILSNLKLYVYALSNPVNFNDPTGKKVDPGSDCGLTWDRDIYDKIKVHTWIYSKTKNDEWDFGPHLESKFYPGATPKSYKVYLKYKDDPSVLVWYDKCGFFDPCEGIAPFNKTAYSRLGNEYIELKLETFFWKKMEAGPAKGVLCECVTCGDIFDCLDAVMTDWDDDDYDHWFHSCINFADDAMYKCCLKK